jgi:Carboxypeptidase regulatory-like domain
MRKIAVRSAFIVLMAVLTTGAVLAQSNATKTLEGKVLRADDAPISGAIVYLQDGKTNDIRSFISTSDGSYRFGQLATDTDYQVWAQYKDAKSPTKSVSSYDSRKQVFIDLRIKIK